MKTSVRLSGISVLKSLILTAFIGMQSIHFAVNAKVNASSQTISQTKASAGELATASENQSEKQYKAYLVSNAHFDTQWNWDCQTSIREYIPKTMLQNLMLMEKYPGYIFNFEGGIKYYWMKEYYPYAYDKVKQYISEGRWHVTGSTWDATDANVPSPESLTRNILYGQQFYKQEFGVTGKDIFLPDCFGFGWTLPTVANHCGLIGFSTQKLQWRNNPFYGDMKIPFEIGLWEGVDGNKIMLAADGHNYTTSWADEDLSQNKRLLNIAKNNPTGSVYHYYGTGDTGGAPTIQSVITLEQSLKGNGPLKIISATSDQLYQDYLPFEKHPELPVFKGELLMDVHGTGCYTSQSAMKKYNRSNEILGNAAERAAFMADALGGISYPAQKIGDSWRRFIWHQFHDDLTGTSIPRAYEFSWNDELISMKQFAEVIRNSSGSVANALNTNVSGTPLVIYNPVAAEISEVIEIEVDARTPDLKVMDEKGTEVPSQLISMNDNKAKLLVAARLPSCGYVVYEIRKGKPTLQKSTLLVNSNSLENARYKLELDKNGDISSIFDKSLNAELVKEGKAVRLALFTKNESFHWPAWEVLKSTIDQPATSIDQDVKLTVIENGPVRISVCVERKSGESVFKQYIRLTQGAQDDRIDIYNDIDWKSTNALLKAEFPLNLNAPKAVYDLGVGAVERGNNTLTAYEVYSQGWADMFDSTKNRGVSLLTDFKYGWDKPDNHTLRLTLLHTPGTEGRYTYQNRQDFGRHQFTYSIIGHSGTYVQAGTVFKAEVMKQPSFAFVSSKHKGQLGNKYSFVQIDNPNVQLVAMKKAENTDDLILRFYETAGKKENVRIQFASDILSAVETNGVEEKLADLKAGANFLELNMGAFGMKTVSIKLKHTPQIGKPDYEQLPLQFNLKTASFNAYRGDANFDGKGNAFAAELFASTLQSGAYEVKLRSPEYENGMKLIGDTILLPKGKYNRLILFAAATRKDEIVRLKLDNEEKQVIVPYYSGFIGQWGHDDHTQAFLKPQDIAFVGTHRHSAIRNSDLPMEYSYIFPIELAIPEGSSKLILPMQSNVVLFAALVAKVDKEIKSASDMLRTHLPYQTPDPKVQEASNLLFGKPVTETSGQVNFGENAEMALDENQNTKWCDNGGSAHKFITVDLGQSKSIHQWYVLHAGVEGEDYISSEFSLKVKENAGDDWKEADKVVNNKENETERQLTVPVKARYVRLDITKGEQSPTNVSRIYEFAVK